MQHFLNEVLQMKVSTFCLATKVEALELQVSPPAYFLSEAALFGGSERVWSS